MPLRTEYQLSRLRTLADLYREFRKPLTGIGVTDTGYYRYYHQPTAACALTQARHELQARPMRRLWDRLESLHFVRLTRHAHEECFSVNELAGDCDHPACCNARNCKDRRHDCKYCKLCQSALDTANNDGVWFVVSEYNTTACDCGPSCDSADCPSKHWETADSLGAVIGELDSGYADDLKSAGIDALRSALRDRLRIRVAVRAGLAATAKAGAA